MILVVGLSHRSAPIEVRERVALSDEAASAICHRLHEAGEVREVFVVSTCNRVELFVVPGEDEARSAKACVDELVSRDIGARPHVYLHRDLEAVRHLVKVASSLDSLVVGEPQILGQLRHGFELGRGAGTVGPVLHRVFARAVRGARQIRSSTSIGAGQVSVPSIAVELTRQIFGSLEGHHAVLIGAGEMGQAVARLLFDAGARISVVGRDKERIRPIAAAFGSEPLVTTDVPDLLRSANVVVTSTSATDYVISKADVERAQKKRRGQNLFFVDLAVPRDVEPTVGDLEGVFLYNIDDLGAVAEQSTKSRQREAERAQSYVEDVVSGFRRWAEAEQATPTIKALRARMHQAFEQEMQRSLRLRLRSLDDEQRQALSKMVDAGINRLLHGPTLRLREAATRGETASGDENGVDYADVLAELFDLDDVPSELLDAPSLAPPADMDLPEEPISERVRRS